MPEQAEHVAVGIFSSHEQAERALSALEQAGFGPEQTGYLTPQGRGQGQDLSGEITSGHPEPAATGLGAIEGGTIGGLLGAGTALLIPGLGPALAGGILVATIWGAAIGTVAGGLIAAFISMGVPEEEARHYQEAMSRGKTLVVVKAGSRQEVARQILAQAGAEEEQTPPKRPGLSRS